jgi:SAM-dependent methyltransferase
MIYARKFKDLLEINPSKKNLLKGVIKFIRNFICQKVYKFDKWHVKPSEFSAYSQSTIKMINSISNVENYGVLEIGCGLAGILSEINCEKKYGCDIDSRVLEFSKIINKNIEFIEKPINEINFEDIDIVICIGFLHLFQQRSFEEFIVSIFNNDIEYFCVDRMYKNQKTMLEYDIIAKYGYEEMFVSEKFNNMKEIVIYKKNNINL